MAKGSRKGAAFERAICRKLSLWWTRNLRDDVFWRTSQSGGRATERAKKGQSTFGQFGDIAANDPIGKPLLDCFTWELKHGYSTTPFLNLSECCLSPFILKWMVKLDAQVNFAGAMSWALIYKADNKATLIMIPVRFFQLHAPALRARVLALPHLSLPWRISVGRGDNITEDVLVMPLDSFLAGVRPEDIPLVHTGSKD